MASSRGSYTEPGQLQDVLALIQVLAFATEPRRTVVQLADALRTPPSKSVRIRFTHREFRWLVDQGIKAGAVEWPGIEDLVQIRDALQAAILARGGR